MQEDDQLFAANELDESAYPLAVEMRRRKEAAFMQAQAEVVAGDVSMTRVVQLLGHQVHSAWDAVIQLAMVIDEMHHPER